MPSAADRRSRPAVVLIRIQTAIAHGHADSIAVHHLPDAPPEAVEAITWAVGG